MEKKLNLGCGRDIKKGFVNLDKLKLKGVDVVHDMEKIPYPFKDNSFDYVFCSHVLEHVHDIDSVLKELKRITKNHGIIDIHLPHFSCGVTYRDPTHKRFFSYFTFDYYTNKWFYNNLNFKIKKRKLNFTRMNATFLNPIINPLVNLSPVVYERFFCWIFPVSEIIIELEVQK